VSSDAVDLLGSVLASTLRGWRGTSVRGAARDRVQPAKLPELYDIENCPYCRLVREVLTEIDLDVLVKPCPKGGKRFREEARAKGGKALFPFLVDPNTGTRLYESADIIDYLYGHYGADAAPAARKLHGLRIGGSMLASGARLAAGTRARPSSAPRKPLELFGFESSPYTRRVRERLCELELPYLLRNTGKAIWQDMGPPGLRRALFPELPVQGRNREELLRRAGKVQVPWLADPNTGESLFESADICAYLLETYGSA
jgi:glutathione S-transferase